LDRRHRPRDHRCLDALGRHLSGSVPTMSIVIAMLVLVAATYAFSHAGG
jgi:hypothetical protein